MPDQSWKRTAAAKVRRLSPEQAQAVLARITEETQRTRGTIFHADIRELTGGLNSQSINFHVTRLLAKRAGIIR
jgi:hypothetical protein